jgi:hypothetical protein
MSDDLDPQLLRAFATANTPLSDDGFHARVLAAIERPSGWRGVAHATGATLRAIGSGLMIGMTAPFRQGMSFRKLATIAIAAIASCLAFLAV